MLFMKKMQADHFLTVALVYFNPDHYKTWIFLEQPEIDMKESAPSTILLIILMSLMETLKDSWTVSILKVWETEEETIKVELFSNQD
jgi:hypothetical protein